jgi:hypothetical protein
MGLFPPWMRTFSASNGMHVEAPYGYAFITNPPERYNVSTYDGHEGVDRRYGIKIDATRLFIQWLVVVFGYSVAFIVIKFLNKQ